MQYKSANVAHPYFCPGVKERGERPAGPGEPPGVEGRAAGQEGILGPGSWSVRGL